MIKILITSIPCWNQRTGANTYSTLLEGIDKESLANIYISPELPDSDICSRYFNIREWKVVKSIFNRKIATGEEVHVIDKHVDNQLNQELQLTRKFARKRRRVFLWLRELAWCMGKWKSKELDAFLDDFNPDVLVFSIESYPYYNRLNEYIINKCKPKKVLGYLWDDNFTYKQFPNSIFFKLERYFLRKQVRRLVGLCSDVLAISPKMKRECDAEFGIDSILVTKPLRESSASPYEFKGFPIRVLYTGSLVIGRDKVLMDLAKAINKINECRDLVSLDIYTMTPVSKQYKDELSSYKLCTLHGGISQSDVFVEQENSDILVFVESLEPNNQVARLSFSTKITDYISSRRCVLVIGQNTCASVEYFKENNAAIICDNISTIIENLNAIVNNPNIIKEYALKAEVCGKKNHSKEEILQTFKNVLDV